MKNKKIFFATVFIILFFLVLKDVFQYEVTSYDNWAYSVFVEDLRSNEMTTLMKAITAFGSMINIGIIFILLLLLYKNKKTILILILNTISIVLINDFIKFLIKRPRPYGYNLINESNYSFPSGHSMVSTVFYGFLIYLVYTQIKDKKIKYILIGLLSLLIVLICISRIYLGVHYLSDTIAGFSISIVYIMTFLIISDDMKERDNYEKKRKTKTKKKV